MNENIYMVKLYDGTMGYGATCVLFSNLTRAVAKSIVRHFSRELCRTESKCGCSIDMSYYVESIYDREPDLDYWR